MDVAAYGLFNGLAPMIKIQKQMLDFRCRLPSSQFFPLSSNIISRENTRGQWNRSSDFIVVPIHAVLAGLEDACYSPSEDVEVIAFSSDDGQVKIRVHISGAKTQVIFDDVFSNMVAAAQPIPGFRRIKGGKTPDIPKDVLLQILGPSKVYKHSIKKIINNSVAEHAEKEGLKVTEDLQVEESYEELEASFEPGKEFSFNAVIRLVESGKQ